MWMLLLIAIEAWLDLELWCETVMETRYGCRVNRASLVDNIDFAEVDALRFGCRLLGMLVYRHRRIGFVACDSIGVE